MELVHLAGHILAAAGKPRSLRTIHKNLQDLVASCAFSQRKLGKFNIVRRNSRFRVADPGHFRDELRRRLPGAGRRTWTATEVQEWRRAQELLRRAEELLPVVEPFGVLIPSRVKPLERLRRGKITEAERILSSPTIVQFLYRDGIPADLYQRLLACAESFHAQLAKLEARTEFANSRPTSLSKLTPEPLATGLAVLAAAGQAEKIRAIVDNMGLENAEVDCFLRHVVPIARPASTSFKQAKAAEQKLREHLLHHANLPRPPTLLDLAES